jgi:hypothetical protein
VPDTVSGGDRISSAAFTDPELSVDLARLVEGNDFHVTMKDGAGVAEFPASAAFAPICRTCRRDHSTGPHPFDSRR